jgi:two-component system, OmpR family, response regulator RpaB
MAGRSILVVDDEVLLRDLLARSLKHAGYMVQTAQTGEEALAAFARSPFDLVLVDVRMPGMNGYALCAALRQMSDVPIILLTSLGAPDEIVHGYGVGADDYITKPFQLREIEARIQALLRRPAEQQPRQGPGLERAS